MILNCIHRILCHIYSTVSFLSIFISHSSRSPSLSLSLIHFILFSIFLYSISAIDLIYFIYFIVLFHFCFVVLLLLICNMWIYCYCAIQYERNAFIPNLMLKATLPFTVHNFILQHKIHNISIPEVNMFPGKL